MAEFMAELREQGWSDLDVRKVESAVRKVLAGVVSEYSDDPASE
jgi:hypothetical protein